MTVDAAIKSIQVGDWVVKVREPNLKKPWRVILLIHGWTGDENSMWVFSSQLPEDALLIAPRAPYPSTVNGSSGFSWRQHKSGEWSWLDDYKPAIKTLNQLIGKVETRFGYDLSSFSVMGFSQGAAVAYVYAILNPERIEKVAGLAGFMPERSEAEIAQRPLEGIPVFVAHGKRDNLIPIERAKMAVDILERAGARVNYCEADVGHKLGANCSRELKKFFRDG